MCLMIGTVTKGSYMRTQSTLRRVQAQGTCFLVALLCFLSLAAPALAQQIAGKVVGVTNGDTIKVLAAGHNRLIE